MDVVGVHHSPTASVSDITPSSVTHGNPFSLFASSQSSKSIVIHGRCRKGKKLCIVLL